MAKTGDAGGGDGGGGVVLRRVDVAGGPAHIGAERLQRLDQHRRLDGHVQRAGDARALERLRGAVFGAGRHQAGHLGLGDVDLLAAPGGEAHVLDDEIGLAHRAILGRRAGRAGSSMGDPGGCNQDIRISLCESFAAAARPHPGMPSAWR